MQRTTLWMAALAAASVYAVADAARAQEYCVSCTGPEAVYRCAIDGAQPRGGQSLQMLCVTTMAKEGGHAACSVKGGTVFDCNGPLKRVPWASQSTSAPETAQPPAPPPPQQPAVVQQPPAPEAPPKTVEEMARRANQKTADQMKKAGDTMKEGAKSVGDAIGSATKKTWDCMISLFTKCGG